MRQEDVVEMLRVAGAEEKIKKRLSGEGHIGAFCPKCYQPLEFRDREVLSDIYEYWVCRECLTQYSVRYSAVDWREEKGAEDLELEERVKKLKLTESDKFIKQLKRLWDYAP